jgi:hypothetical protein
VQVRKLVEPWRQQEKDAHYNKACEAATKGRVVVDSGGTEDLGDGVSGVVDETLAVGEIEEEIPEAGPAAAVVAVGAQQYLFPYRRS